MFRDENRPSWPYQEGVITLQAPIKVRRTLKWGGETRSKLVDTTAGRIIFNTPIPGPGLVDRSTPDGMFELK